MPVTAGTLTSAEIPVRLAARALDVVVVVILSVALGRRMGFGFDWLVIGAALIWLYFAGLDTLAGATLGKLAAGLRVVGDEGQWPSLTQSLKREAFTVVGAIPFVGPIIAIGLWVWFLVVLRQSPTRQGPHDVFAGGTRVVRWREPGIP
jgi:uncharacterized RDD family membrane protein YckC